MTNISASPVAEETTYCAVHTDVEASLRCIRCNRYMCMKCVVHTPVGYVCRECAHQHDNRFFDATSTDGLLIFATCAGLTGIGAALIAAINLPLFFLLFLGFPIGGAIGEAALRVTKRRRSRNSHWLGAGGAVVGGLIGAIIQSILYYNQVFAPLLAQLPEAGRQAALNELGFYASALEFALNTVPTDLSVLLFVGIVAFAVYGRYKMRL